MSDVHLEREFAVTPDVLFDFVTSTDGLLQWWGPEGMHVPEHQLDFTKTGPWFSVMVNAEGQRHKVSGHVTHIDAPKSVGFTWAWHDDDDKRGEESHVTLTVTPCAKGAKLVLDHRELATADIAERQTMGWTSSLNKRSKAIG